MKKSATLLLLACLSVLNAYGGQYEERTQDQAMDQSSAMASEEYGESHTALDAKESAIGIPPGMELRKIGGISMIVPEGTQVSKKSGLVVMEGPDEFAARNIYEMRGRLMTLEERQHDVEKELNDLKETISKLQQKPETGSQ
ncbi:MAG: hypothetical protein V1682_02870 [Candidatus Omnitrophota bacterium]